MRPITPALTDELRRRVGKLPVWKAPAFEVDTYRALGEQVARLSYANPSQLLFFRGQDKDFQSKAGGTTLYPSIYRGDNVPQREIEYRFEQLQSAAHALTKRLAEESIEGHRDVARKRLIQWSILQHYGVAPTPLLDVTHSLRVACSFAQDLSRDPTCYVYAIGLPFISNRIAINSEEDIVNVRLLSICPPAALRPHFQEGYMVGTPDVAADYESKTDLDFRNRLVAKFAIPRAPKHFWGSFAPLPQSALYPSGDQMKDICDGLRPEASALPDPTGTLGDFVLQWAALEQLVLNRARHLEERNLSLREAIATLSRQGVITEELAKELDSLRMLRNIVVHEPNRLPQVEVDLATANKRLRDVKRRAHELLGSLPPTHRRSWFEPSS